MGQKKILYIFQYFRHPGEPGGTRAYWIAQEFIKSGYSITLITQKNSFNPEYRDAKPLERVNIDGIDVIYIKNSYANTMSLSRRFLSFLMFMFKAVYYGLKEKNIDLLMTSSTPLSVGFPALVIKKLKRIPLLFEVRDLWPEVPIQMKIIKNTALIRFLRWFEKTIYRNSVHVVALSPGMAEGVEKYIPGERVSVIPNMAKIDKFWSRKPDVGLCKTFGLSEHSFKAIHFGQMGISNDLHYIVNAAKRCVETGNGDIEFIFMGSGKIKEEIRKRAITEGIPNIRIIDRQPMNMVSEIVNLCDVSLVTFTDLPILYTNSPNKLFDSLSAGKPLIVNSAGWTKDMVEQNHCGFFVNPAAPSDLADKLVILKNDRQLLAEMGGNARRLAEEKYDKSILCNEYVKLVDRLMGSASKHN